MRVRAEFLPLARKSTAPAFSIYLGLSHRSPWKFSIDTPGNFDIELILPI